MEPHNEEPLVKWSAPQCLYTVEYAPSTLDDIRLAVMDAFFSLPRGGAEIGGILLGYFRDGGLRILDYRPLDCEHATGPSFTLSDRDRTRLAELLAEAAKGPPERQPVGWYHSHTRSEIFLSEADREIHSQYFLKPWQTALVLRPHIFHPARAAFFFREADGSMTEEVAGREFVLEALAVRPAPGAQSAAAAQPVPEAPAPVQSEAPAITPAPMAKSRFATSADEQPDEQEPTIPRFLETPSAGSSRHAVLKLAILGGCLAVAGAAFQTRPLWLPRVAALYRHSEQPPPLFLGLNAIDLAGQLQIRWDRNSPAVRQAAEGLLVILDGTAPHANELDAAHLQAGVFTYARRTERVDITLSARLPDGRVVREATSFLGKPLEPGSTTGNLELRQTQEDFAKQTAKLKSDLKAQTERTRTLEKSMAAVQKQLKDQQSRRMLNQEAGK